MNLWKPTTAALIGAVFVSGASAAVLIDQSPFDDFGFYSDGVAGQFYDQRMADDFTLGIGAEVTKIVWWGSSENFFGPVGLDNFSDWVIRIYEDNSGNVGSEVFGATFSKASTNPVFTGSLSSAQAEIYRQEASLSLNLDAGTYWVSIGTINVVAEDDAWAWHASANVFNDQLAAELGFGSGYTTFGEFGDLAFQIEGNPVPEPATLIALGIGAAAFAARRRRK
jgi:hypothetical protein